MAKDTKSKTGLSPKREPSDMDVSVVSASEGASLAAGKADSKKPTAKKSGAKLKAQPAAQAAGKKSSKTAKIPSDAVSSEASSESEDATAKATQVCKHSKHSSAKALASVRNDTAGKGTRTSLPGKKALAAEVSIADMNRHAAHVEFLAITLFKELNSIHNLGEPWEKRLRLAARFHDIGWRGGRSGHHKASMHIIEKENLGIDETDRPFVALLARYHRKAWPSQKHKRFAALSHDDRAAVRKLAAILRIADGLDYTREGAVKGLTLEVRETKSGKKRAVLSLACTEEAPLEVARALKKGDLFEEVFSMELRISCSNQ